MREMLVNHAHTHEGVVLDILVLDKEENQFARDTREYINIARALEDLVIIVENVNVDKIYVDRVGLGDVFTEALDNLLQKRRSTTVVHSIHQVNHTLMYKPQEVTDNGHQTDCLFRI